MERLTQKNEFFEYVLPEQNIFGDNQAYEISLGKTEYICKLHITGEAIKRFGELEDVLEKYKIENLEEYISALIEARNFAIKERNAMFSKYIKETIKTEKLETELTELKQKAIVLPKELQVGCKIFWANEDGVYSGKLYAVTKDINPDGCFNIWLYCLYDNGLSYSHLIEDFEVELFATKEEAEQKLTEIKGEKDE